MSAQPMVNAAPGTAASAGPPFKRRTYSAWRRLAMTPMFWVVVWPMSKILSRRWPLMLSRGITRMLGTFPKYEPSSGDVFVCSYFKSGTNWTMHISLQIAFRGRARFEHIHEVVPWPEVPERMRMAVPLADDRPRATSPTGLRVIKTHLALDAVPYSPAARYVAVVRDPKDVFVSSYHFLRSVALSRAMPSVRRWLDVYLSPDTALGSWAAHLQSYWSVRDRPNVLFLSYEQMRADLPGTVDKIAKLMSVELTAEERSAVIEQCTFEHMKKIGAKFDPAGPPWASSQGAMIRRGEPGKSGELLSSAEQKRIDDYWRAQLVNLRSDFPYDRAFANAD